MRKNRVYKKMRMLSTKEKNKAGYSGSSELVREWGAALWSGDP